LVSGGGDQQCAGIGAGAVRPGIAEYTLGTAGVLLAYTDGIVKDPRMRITCCAHAVPGKFEVEGLQSSSGSSLDWIKRIACDHERFGKKFFRRLAAVRPGSNGAFFYPFLAGASAPHWNPNARAVLTGLTHAHDRAAIVRSVMEGVSMETRQIIDVFNSLGIPVREIRLTGGASGIEVWNRIQADIYGKKVFTLSDPEASLVGAAILASCGIGAFGSVQDAAARMVKVDKRCEPEKKSVKMYADVYKRYCEFGNKLLNDFWPAARVSGKKGR
jgi:xylulokinase